MLLCHGYVNCNNVVGCTIIAGNAIYNGAVGAYCVVVADVPLRIPAILLIRMAVVCMTSVVTRSVMIMLRLW